MTSNDASGGKVDAAAAGAGAGAAAAAAAEAATTAAAADKEKRMESSMQGGPPSTNLNVTYPHFATAQEMYAHLRQITAPVSMGTIYIMVLYTAVSSFS
jgi:hypothetical protein